MRVSKRWNGDIDITDPFVRGLVPIVGIPAKYVPALREYFLRERDEELGLWRDPEDPTKVVYPILGGSNTVYVLNEVTGLSNVWVRTKEPGSYYDPTALRYFEEHPDRGLRPWEHAEKGEVWVLSFSTGAFGGSVPALAVDDGYGNVEFDLGGLAVAVNDHSITTGKRVWPEGNDD